MEQDLITDFYIINLNTCLKMIRILRFIVYMKTIKDREKKKTSISTNR